MSDSLRVLGHALALNTLRDQAVRPVVLKVAVYDRDWDVSVLAAK